RAADAALRVETYTVPRRPVVEVWAVRTLTSPPSSTESAAANMLSEPSSPKAWQSLFPTIAQVCSFGSAVNREVCQRSGRTRPAIPREPSDRLRWGWAHEGVDDRNNRRSIALTRPRSWQATPGLRNPDEDRPTLKGRPSLSLPIRVPMRWI